MASEPAQLSSPVADAARQRINTTITEIQERLNPRRILGDGLEKVSGGTAQLAVAARGAARAHPLALAAAAAAVGLALLARKRLAGARVDLGDDFGDYTDYDDGFVVAEDGPAPRALAARPAPTAIKTPETKPAESNPIVSIVIGLAAGAALGAIFPTTDAEREALGDTGNRLGDAARRAARRAFDEFGTAVKA